MSSQNLLSKQLNSVQEETEAEEMEQNYHSLDFLELNSGESFKEIDLLRDIKRNHSYTPHVNTFEENFQKLSLSLDPNTLNSMLSENENNLTLSLNDNVNIKKANGSLGYFRSNSLERKSYLNDPKVWVNPSLSDKLPNRRTPMYERRHSIGRTNSLGRDSIHSKRNTSIIRTFRQSNISNSYNKDLINNYFPANTKNIIDKYGTLPRRKMRMSNSEKNHNTRSEADANAQDQESPKTSSSASLNSCSSLSTNDSAKNEKFANLNTKNIPNFGNNKQVNRAHSLSSKNAVRMLMNRNLKRNVEVQANLKWNPNGFEFEEKLRKVVDENMSLQQRLQVAELNSKNNEFLTMENSSLLQKLHTEKLDKEKLQKDLDKSTIKLKHILISLENIEREYTNRGQNLAEMENRFRLAMSYNVQLQEELNASKRCCAKLQSDLQESVSRQSSLMHQVEDFANEGHETADFIAEEKNILAEALKDAEEKIAIQSNEMEELKLKLSLKNCTQVATLFMNESINPEEEDILNIELDLSQNNKTELEAKNIWTKCEHEKSQNNNKIETKENGALLSKSSVNSCQSNVSENKEETSSTLIDQTETKEKDISVFDEIQKNDVLSFNKTDILKNSINADVILNSYTVDDKNINCNKILNDSELEFKKPNDTVADSPDTLPNNVAISQDFNTSVSFKNVLLKSKSAPPQVPPKPKLKSVPSFKLQVQNVKKVPCESQNNVKLSPIENVNSSSHTVENVQCNFIEDIETKNCGNESYSVEKAKDNFNEMKNPVNESKSLVSVSNKVQDFETKSFVHSNSCPTHF